MASAGRVSLSDSDLSSAPSSGATAGGIREVAAAADWQTAEGSRRKRRMFRRQEQELLQPRRRKQLPAAHPPPHRHIPPGLHGLCYNCALPGHIAKDCTGDVWCIVCGETGHISRGCKRPRSPSGSSAEDVPRAAGAHARLGRVEAPSGRSSGQELPPPPPGRHRRAR
jgi:hypothetical protein